MKWYFAALKKYAVFSGRATRAEYWTFLLFNIIMLFVLVVIDLALFPETEEGVLILLYSLAVWIPGIAVGVRRLHDTGRSGWWLLIGLIPIIGPIILFVWVVQDSETGENEYGPNPKGVDKDMRQQADSNSEKGIAVNCEKCSQKMTFPKPDTKIRVRCPSCAHEFDYKYNVFGFLPSTKKYVGVGIVAGVAGTILFEIIGLWTYRIESIFISEPLTIASVPVCLAAVMGAAEGFFNKDRERLLYGLKSGIIFGALSGVVAGFIGQIIFSGILWDVDGYQLGRYMLARTLGWCVLGILIGGSYGIKENTAGDLKFGMIGGAIGGAIGGVLFDPIDFMIDVGYILLGSGDVGSGFVPRLVGNVALSIAVCVSINRFKEVALRSDKPEMYRQLSTRLPTNSRLLSTGRAGPPPENGSKWGESQ